MTSAKPKWPTKPICLFIFCLGAILICSCTPKVNSEIRSAEDNSTIMINGGSHQGIMKDATYVADSKCAECHQEIYDSYQSVAMAKSFYDFSGENVTEDFENNLYYHQPSDNYYQMEISDGDFFVTRFKMRADESRHHVHRQKVDYVVGSGNHVRTYLYRNKAGEVFQLPIVWYSQDKKWGMAPGYDRPDHLDFHRPITRHCMFCHNAYPDFVPGSDAFGKPHHFPADLPQGIGCQRCHGPGSEHIRISNELDQGNGQDLIQIRNSIVNTGKMDAQAQDDVCFQCHLQPMSQRTSFIRRFGTGDYGYSAGDRLDQYMLHFEPDRDNDTADHFEINHHPYRLRQSRCFTKTEGGIRCTTCHDPHRKIAKPDQADFYRNKCFTCHQKNDCLDTERGRLPDSDCVACHMPQRRTTDVVHVTMTDHKISRKPNRAELVAKLDEIDVPIDMPIRLYPTTPKTPPLETSRLYQYFARVLDDDEIAFDLLQNEVESQSIVDTAPNLQLLQKRIQYRQWEKTRLLVTNLERDDTDLALFKINRSLLDSTGTASQIDSAVKRLKSVVDRDPANASAWYNLGVMYANLKAYDQATECFTKSIQVRPNYVKPHLKMGSLLALNDSYDRAEAYFLDALKLDVRNLEAYQKLASVYRRTNQWHKSISVLNDALRIAPTNQRTLTNLVLNYLDVQNRSFKNPDEAVRLSSRLIENDDNSVDVALLKALAKVESDSPNEALKFLSQVLKNENRRAEVGLILAIAQNNIGAKDSATTNYEGAKKAIRVRDRLSRIILDYANSVFENGELDN